VGGWYLFSAADEWNFACLTDIGINSEISVVIDVVYVFAFAFL